MIMILNSDLYYFYYEILRNKIVIYITGFMKRFIKFINIIGEQLTKNIVNLLRTLIY